jgi:hypothetical protein
MSESTMTRPARIWLHAAVMRRTLSVRRSGRMATIRFHGAGILRAVFCDWPLLHDMRDSLHGVTWALFEFIVVMAAALAVVVAMWIMGGVR